MLSYTEWLLVAIVCLASLGVFLLILLLLTLAHLCWRFWGWWDWPCCRCWWDCCGWCSWFCCCCFPPACYEWVWEWCWCWWDRDMDYLVSDQDGTEMRSTVTHPEKRGKLQCYNWMSSSGAGWSGCPGAAKPKACPECMSGPPPTDNVYVVESMKM